MIRRWLQRWLHREATLSRPDADVPRRWQRRTIGLPTLAAVLPTLVVLLLGLALAPRLAGQELTETVVFIEPFQNETGSTTLEPLGRVLIGELTLTIALLDGFVLTERREEADIRITTAMRLTERDAYRSVNAIVRNGETVAEVDQTFESIFDVFDAGGAAGEELLATYTNQVLEFARLTITPTRTPAGLEITIDGLPLDTGALQFDRVLAGSRRIEARFAAATRPFFSRTVELEPDGTVSVPIDVPAASPGVYQAALRDLLAQQVQEQPAANETRSPAAIRTEREQFARALTAATSSQPLAGPRVTPLPHDAISGVVERYDDIAGSFQLPRFRNEVISIDGDPAEWASVPVHNQSMTSIARYAHDDDRFYGLIVAENLQRGEGLEVSIAVYDGPGTGSEAARINIPMARSNDTDGVRLSVFANTGGSWSTRYETSSTAVYRDGYLEFSVPARAVSAPRVASNDAGIPARITIDTEAGVTLSGTEFRYELYDFSGRRTLNAQIEE